MCMTVPASCVNPHMMLSLTTEGSTLATHSTRRAGAGTKEYQAPEQFDDEFTVKSEVYSFAIILWELMHCTLMHCTLCIPFTTPQ